MRTSAVLALMGAGCESSLRSFSPLLLKYIVKLASNICKGGPLGWIWIPAILNQGTQAFGLDAR